jgi:D-serine deaminase-like pyridoxal phosphate-dependent protein
MSDEELRAEVERLRAENEALKSKESRELRLQVSAKKGVSLYGIRTNPSSSAGSEAQKQQRASRERDWPVVTSGRAHPMECARGGFYSAGAAGGAASSAMLPASATAPATS